MDPIIVALDYDTTTEAAGLMTMLADDVSRYKVGHQLYSCAGLQMVKWLVDHKKKVFLDLKIDDIPSTVRATARLAAKMGVRYFSIQNEPDTEEAAQSGRTDASKDIRHMRIFRVSTLSSREPKMTDVFQSGAEGIIASGPLVNQLRARYGDELPIIATGIRLYGESVDDHKRTLTPAQAVEAGANYIVLGRSITRAKDPKAVIKAVRESIAALYQEEV